MRWRATASGWWIVWSAWTAAAWSQDTPYVPPRGEWERRAPADAGFDAERLQEAVEFAKSQDASTSRDLRAYIESTLANEPHGAIVGPVRDRGDTNGVVVRGGYLVAEWGPVERVDMTFSVTKTYLSTVVGLAWDEGLIPDVDAAVTQLVPTEHFESPKNRAITWDHLLRQTSDWQGTLWDKPDWADRPPRGASEEQARNVARHDSGTHYEYNDVRVNLLALAALHVWREPLPVVLRHRLMDPIGASASWRWHGYDNSWITLDGLRMQSVSGGGHWGGGMQIHTLDHARFGLLFLRDGVWGDERLLSSEWIAKARTPGSANATYGYMNWFLNAERPTRNGGTTRMLPSAPESAVMFRGAGSNLVYLDWEHDLVAVLRWYGRDVDGFVSRLLAALE